MTRHRQAAKRNEIADRLQEETLAIISRLKPRRKSESRPAVVMKETFPNVADSDDEDFLKSHNGLEVLLRIIEEARQDFEDELYRKQYHKQRIQVS